LLSGEIRAHFEGGQNQKPRKRRRVARDLANHWPGVSGGCAPGRARPGGATAGLKVRVACACPRRRPVEAAGDQARAQINDRGKPVIIAETKDKKQPANEDVKNAGAKPDSPTLQNGARGGGRQPDVLVN